MYVLAKISKRKPYPNLMYKGRYAWLSLVQVCDVYLFCEHAIFNSTYPCGIKINNTMPNINRIK